MPIFMIERRFVEDHLPTFEGAAEVNAINDEENVRWLYSFLSADKRKTYCLYEATSVEAIHRAARRAGSRPTSWSRWATGSRSEAPLSRSKADQSRFKVLASRPPGSDWRCRSSSVPHARDWRPCSH